MAITWVDVVALAPELSDVVEGGQEAILAWVNDSDTFNTALWRGATSSMLHLGRCYLAAHIGALYTQGSAGAVTARSVGGVSESFGTLTSGTAIGSTGYGQMFQFLARSAAGGPVLV